MSLHCMYNVLNYILPSITVLMKELPYLLSYFLTYGGRSVIFVKVISLLYRKKLCTILKGKKCRTS
jgi:hypothetical protein